MQLQGKIKVLMDKKDKQSGKVTGCLILLDNSDKWLQCQSFQSAIKKKGIDKDDEVIVDVEEHTLKGNKTYYTFQVEGIKKVTRKSENTSTTKSNTEYKGNNYSSGAQIGCAYNNACLDARKKGDISEQFIFKAALFHYRCLLKVEEAINNGEHKNARKGLEEAINNGEHKNSQVDLEDYLEDDLDQVFAYHA